jgi:hypothetical protein
MPRRVIFRTKPWPHQVTALKFTVRRRSALVQCPMRWGKSWVGINWAAALNKLEGVQRVLVITVTSGLGVWEDQIAEHCPLGYEILNHHGELLDRTAHPEIQFMLVNYENLYTRAYTEGRSWTPVSNSVLRKFNPDAMIADEVHHLGTPTAVSSRHAYALARDARFKLGMTGTMFHRKPQFVYGEMRFIDDGRTFGTQWSHFKERICVMGGWGNYEVVAYKNLEWMMDKVKKWAYIERNTPKRPTIQNKLTFRLTGKHLEAYQEMNQHNILEVEGEVLQNEIVLTRHLRLLQLAGGFVKLPSGKYACVGTSKLEMFQDRITEYLEQGINKAVVGCRFLPELAACAKVAKKVGFNVIVFHGGIPKGDQRTRRYKLFQSTKKPTLFISQISAGKESIQLDQADTLLYYSLTESYVDFDQFNARIDSFDTKRTLMYDYLLARGTHDIVAFEAMRMKIDVATFMVSHPRRVEQLTRKR